jgi:hypothetical protein
MKYALLFRFLVLFAASTLAVFAGCGYDNGLSLARVQGRVTFKGEHVKKGTVFFFPDEGKGTVGPSAVGSLREDGTYVASTDYSGDGVIIGSHKIGLTGMEAASDDDVAAAPDAEKNSAEFIQSKVKTTRKQSVKKGLELFTDRSGKKWRYVVPKRLSNPNESGVVAKVERGSNTLNFDIDENGQVKMSQ